MANATVFDLSGKKTGEIELSSAVFGIEPNATVVHEVVKNHLANRRQGTQSALTRAEVSGGGKKPWRQKGTGHARQGSTRSPQWTHGGIAFAPKPRDYSYTVNRKVKRLALKSVLSAKAAAGEIMVVDGLELSEIKTKTMGNLLTGIGAGKSVIITAEHNEKVYRSSRNLKGVIVTSSKLLSVYDLVNAKNLVIDKAALTIIEEVFAS
ncbi:MAG: 50S ribosomal protein L4 [Eubacteriales bacterium]